MNKNKWNKWRRYLIVSFIGIFLFSIFIPSCTYLSSANFDVLVRDQKPEAIAEDTKSLAEILADLPTAEEIQAMPLAAHPRLLASEARFAEIKEQIKTDETMKEWYEKLHRYAERLLQEELPTYRLPDGKRLTKRIHIQVTALALVYYIEKDRRYLDRVWQELKTVAEFPDWNPSHFLDTAEMTYAFAVSYDWLHQDWNKEQRAIISSAILEKGLKPAMTAYQSGARWTTAEHNWNQVCNGGVGMGALAVIDEYPQLASQILYESIQRLPKAMRNYIPDGGYKEGMWYWHYGTFYNTVILAALDTSFRTDFNLSNIPGFAQTGLFPIYMNGTSNVTFNYYDGDEFFIRAPQLFWMAERYNQPIYTYYQLQSTAHGALDFIWYKPIDKNIAFKKLPLDRYFKSNQVVSMRSEWENPNSIFVGFKAGDNKVTHSNLDLGTFVIDALGVRWATELGRDDYNLPGYFDREEQRWTYYKTRAEGQNTLVIDPGKEPDQNPQAESRIISFDSQHEKVSVVANLTPAYYPKAHKVIRRIALLRQQKQVLLQDEIQTNTALDLLWFMHTNADIEISQDGKIATLHQDGETLRIKLLNPKPNYQFTVMNAEPLPTSPNPEGQEKDLTLKKLTINLEKINDEQLAVLFVPLNKNQNSYNELPNSIYKSLLVR